MRAHTSSGGCVGTDEASKRLLAAGFKHLSDRAEWDLQAGERYFFTRNASTIVAFAIGAAYRPGNGFHMLGAHTDRCQLPTARFRTHTCRRAAKQVCSARS